MEEEPNPVKELLFDYIHTSEEKLQKLFSQSKMDEIIKDILENCFFKITSGQNKTENIGVLATGVLHYMLTGAMITSQRKVEYQGIELDIVIPDLKTLEKDPKKTLIIIIAKTKDSKVIKKRIEKIKKIQPEEENIWIVSPTHLEFKNKTFVVESNGKSFSKIIFEIGHFVNVQGQNKFKILRV